MEMSTLAAAIALMREQERQSAEAADYEGLRNKPKINNKEISGSMSLRDLGLDDAYLRQVAAKDTSVSVTDKKDIKVNISAAAGNAVQLNNDGLFVQTPAAQDTYAMVKTTGAGLEAKYKLMRYPGGDTTQGVDTGVAVDIPKDMFVQSGAVVVKSEAGTWGQPGTYIEITLANATNDKIYIAASSLIEYVTSGSAQGDEIVITVSQDHKITAAISNNSIVETKLAKAVRDVLDLARTAVQKVVAGSENGTLKVDDNTVAIPGLGSAAYTESSAYDVSGAASAVLGADTDASTANTVYGAKKQTTEQVTRIDTALDQLEQNKQDNISVTDDGNGNVTLAY